MITAKGHSGTVAFDGQFVIITREGLLARMNFGKGEKRIALRSITAVQVKEAGTLTNVFTKAQAPAFAELRDAINAAIAAPSAPAQAAPDLPAQLQQLAELRDQGILSEEVA